MQVLSCTTSKEGFCGSASCMFSRQFLDLQFKSTLFYLSSYHVCKLILVEINFLIFLQNILENIQNNAMSQILCQQCPIVSKDKPTTLALHFI